MSLRQDALEIKELFEKVSPTLETNFILLDIFEGNLLPYVLVDLKKQLNKRAFNVAQNRVPPINILKRVIDKLSQIYNLPPKREVEGTEQDKIIWDFYSENMELDVAMSRSEEYFNLNKAVALEPYLDKYFMPKIRSIPYDRFFVRANDPTDPMRVTEFIKIMGKAKVAIGNNKFEDRIIMFVYSDTEFLIIDDKGEVRDELMAQKNLDGSNPFGKIPFIYINKSHTKVNPPEDTDILNMTKLIPILMTDLNYALMFQTFSIIYGIDVDSEKLDMNPNTFWSLKSDPTKTTTPKIDIIKPEVDSDKALTAIHEQLSLWLQSRNIRPGANGKVGVENFSSGISKMVDEMDTTSERQKTIPYFECAEEALFELIKNHIHPIWSLNPSFEIKQQFSSESELDVDFPLQTYMPTRGELLVELKQEMELNLVSHKTAFKRLNPDYDEADVDEELLAIESDRTVEVDALPNDGGKMADNNGNEAPKV